MKSEYEDEEVYLYEFLKVISVKTKVNVWDNKFSVPALVKYEKEAYKKYLIECGVYINDDDDDNDDQPIQSTSNSVTSSSIFKSRFEPLSHEDSKRVTHILTSPDKGETLIEKFNTPVKKKWVKTLNDGEWLNDEVINFCMCMLQERDDELCDPSNHMYNPSRVPSHYYSSFFMTRLIDNENGEYNYANVKRWSKKFNVFHMDKIFCPINLGNVHWTLLVIYMCEKEIVYYDSMGGCGTKYVEGALKYLEDESAKLGINTFCSDEWELISTNIRVPQQQNGCDCGVFTIMYADFITDNLPLDFSQEHVTLFRKKICANILKGRVGYPI